MSKSRKLTGVELCRGLAAFAVILVHSGDETWGLPISNSAIEFRRLFYFAVPFFIASYFYFATKKAPQAIAQNLWQRKVKRIIIPYIIWSSLFLCSKSFAFMLNENIVRLKNLWSEPLNIVFLGAASYHLYFLPLLISGTILLYFSQYLLKQNTLLLLVESLLAIILYQWLATSDNSFQLGNYTAFTTILSLFDPETFIYPVLRLILVNFAWIISCLPYFFVAILLNHVWKIEQYKWLYSWHYSLLCMLGLIFIYVLKENIAFKETLQVAIAYLLLIFGISISRRLNSSLILNLGYCSFGIYFIHPYIKSVIGFGLTKITPELVQNISIFSMLLYAVLTFVFSWLFIFILKKNKTIAKYI